MKVNTHLLRQRIVMDKPLSIKYWPEPYWQDRKGLQGRSYQTLSVYEALSVSIFFFPTASLGQNKNLIVRYFKYLDPNNFLSVYALAI